MMNKANPGVQLLEIPLKKERINFPLTHIEGDKYLLCRRENYLRLIQTQFNWSYENIDLTEGDYQDFLESRRKEVISNQKRHRNKSLEAQSFDNEKLKVNLSQTPKQLDPINQFIPVAVNDFFDNITAIKYVDSTIVLGKNQIGGESQQEPFSDIINNSKDISFNSRDISCKKLKKELLEDTFRREKLRKNIDNGPLRKSISPIRENFVKFNDDTDSMDTIKNNLNPIKNINKDLFIHKIYDSSDGIDLKKSIPMINFCENKDKKLLPVKNRYNNKTDRWVNYDEDHLKRKYLDARDKKMKQLHTNRNQIPQKVASRLTKVASCLTKELNSKCPDNLDNCNNQQPVRQTHQQINLNSSPQKKVGLVHKTPNNLSGSKENNSAYCISQSPSKSNHEKRQPRQIDRIRTSHRLASRKNYKKAIEDPLQSHGNSVENSIQSNNLSYCNKEVRSCMTNYIFTADNSGNLKQWSANVYCLAHDWGKVHEGRIQSICVCTNSFYLFTSDDKGHQKQYHVYEEKVVMDWGKVHLGGIYSMALTKDEEFLFSSDAIGNMKQWSVQGKVQVQDYDMAHYSSIHCIVTSYDSKFLFSSDCDGNLKQWSIKDRKLIKNWGFIHRFGIESICQSSDGKYLFTSDKGGYQLQWCMKSQNIEYDWGRIDEDGIYGLHLACDGSRLFSNNIFGGMKEIDISHKTIVKSNGFSRLKNVMTLCVSYDGNYLYITTHDGQLSHYSLKDYKQVKNWGRIHDEIIHTIKFAQR